MLFRKAIKKMSSKELIRIGMALMLCALPFTTSVIITWDSISPVWMGFMAGVSPAL
jgi:hypothetical protein